MEQLRAQVDKLLTQAATGYFPKGYISELLFPTIGVVQTTGLLGKWGKSHLRIVNTIVGGKGKFRQVEARTYSTQTYHIDGHGLEGLVTKQDYKNTEKPFDAEKDEALAIETILWLEKEKALADSLADTAVVTQNVTLAGGDQYSDYLNSDPIDDFTTAIDAILDGCGTNSDVVAAMDKKVYNKLRYHPQMLDALGYKYNRPGGLQLDELAAAMNVNQIFVADVAYNSAAEGQTDVLARVWGKHIVFGQLPRKAEVGQVCGGYNIKYSNEQARQVTKWSVNNPSGATAILCEDHYDQLISDVGGLYLIKNAIA